jgi:integrase
MAQREADDFLRKGANNANFQPTSTITFSEFIEHKFRPSAMVTRKKGGQVTADSHLGHYLLPWFGNMPLVAVNAEAVQKMVASMIQNKLGTPSIRGVCGTLSGVFKWARRWDYPVTFVRESLELPPAKKAKRAKFYSLAETLSIIDEAGPFYGLIFLAQCSFALRPWEVLALRVIDLDFENGTVNVEHSSGAAYSGQLTSTKGNNRKAKRMAPPVAAKLQEYLRTSWKANPLGLLFPGVRDGKIIAQSFLRENILYPVLERLGLSRDGRSIHAFRHTAASVLGQNGASTSVIGSALAHQDGGALAAEVYTHVLGGDEMDAIDKLGKAVCGSPRKTPKSCVPDVSLENVSHSAA